MMPVYWVSVILRECIEFNESGAVPAFTWWKPKSIRLSSVLLFIGIRYGTPNMAFGVLWMAHQCNYGKGLKFKMATEFIGIRFVS